MRKLKEYRLIVRYRGYEEVLIDDTRGVFYVPEPGYFYVDYENPDDTGRLAKDLREYAIEVARYAVEDAEMELMDCERRYREWCVPQPKSERDRRYCERLEKEAIPSARAEVEKWRLILDGLERGEAELVLEEKWTK